MPPKVEPVPVRPFDFCGLLRELAPPRSSESNPFDTIQWLDTVEVYLQSLLDGRIRGSTCHRALYCAGLVCWLREVAARKGEVQVLDFGGGVGVNFVNVRAALPVATKLHYGIVDSLANRDRWQRLFKSSDELRIFHRRLRGDEITMSYSPWQHAAIYF